MRKANYLLVEEYKTQPPLKPSQDFHFTLNQYTGTWAVWDDYFAWPYKIAVGLEAAGRLREAPGQRRALIMHRHGLIRIRVFFESFIKES